MDEAVEGSDTITLACPDPYHWHAQKLLAYVRTMSATDARLGTNHFPETKKHLLTVGKVGLPAECRSNRCLSF